MDLNEKDQVYSGGCYPWVIQIQAKNLDLMDLNVFYVMLDLAWMHSRRLLDLAGGVRSTEWRSSSSFFFAKLNGYN